jgi:LacI family transcriptional regulator
MWRMPALPTLLGGVQAAVEEKGLSLLLAHCPDGRLVPPALAATKVDGVLVVGRCGELSASLRSALDRLPVVWLFRTHNDPELRYDHVLYDNREVGPIAARYLHGRGHRKVALVNPDPSHEAYRQRCESFVRVASEVGMAVLEHHADQPLQGPQQLAYFEDMLRSYTHSPEPPTALFCLADDRMLAVFHALRREEFRALAEMELIGCNNDPLFMDQMHPRPATIDIHLDLVGREAGNLLWQRFGEGGNSASLEVFIKPRLVEADCG